MKGFIIDKKDIKNWRNLIRNDIAVLLKSKDVFAAGVEFLGGPQGIIVWNEDVSKKCEIKYIFVSQECRRAGVGTLLVRTMCTELSARGIQEAEYSYSEQDNRDSLSGFFDTVGGVSFGNEYSYGSISVADLKKYLEKNTVTGPSKAIKINDLTYGQKSAADKFINEKTGLSLSDYMSDGLSSFIFSQDKVKAMMLLSRESDIIHLDYMISEASVRDTAELFKSFYNLISDAEDPEETFIDMVLSTPEAEKLYEKAGGTRSTITLVNGFLDVDMVAQDAMTAKMFETLPA